MAILKLLYTWYTWQTNGWSMCMHVLVIGSLFCLHMKKLSIPSVGIQSAPNHKYQTQDKV